MTMTKTRKTRRTRTEAKMASRLAQLAAGYADAEIANDANDASFVAFAACELTLGASGFASVPNVVRTNEYGSDIGGGIALAMRVLGLGDPSEALQAREDSALVSAMIASETRVAGESLADEMTRETASDAVGCAVCAGLATRGFPCRTHAR